MSDSSAPSRTATGRFAAGNPGGPGRPRGAVSAAAAALDQAAVEAQQELLGVVLEKARAGDLKAIEMIWARIWPLRRGRPLAFDLPPVGVLNDVVKTKSAVTEAVLAGEITAQEARPILKVIDSQRDQMSDAVQCKLAGELGEIVLAEYEARVR
jgi:hypothetical protein